MVEVMSIVVNVMSLILGLVRHIGAHGGEVMYFGSFCFRGDLG